MRRRNRELALDALLKAGLGLVFSLFTFGIVFWFSWVLGFFFGRQLDLHPWQFAAIVTGLFFSVATWSAWRRVDPLAGLKPLSDQQLLLTAISQATGSMVYFSPRHASAGLAIILLGGPANLFEAVGIWVHRIRADASLLEKAARLLSLCKTQISAKEVRDPAGAVLLRRLALIKAVPSGASAALALTDKGLALLSGSKDGQANPAATQGDSQAKRKKP